MVLYLCVVRKTERHEFDVEENALPVKAEFGQVHPIF